ncbi:MAG: hypothetical protein HC828_03980 [Blastochloris sp.]|nr:hypothetical protein [Blastochloris sp.]
MPFFYGALLFWFQDLRALLVVGICLVSCGFAGLSHWLLQRGSVYGCILVICTQLSVLPITVTLVYPMIYPAATLIPLLMVTMSLPFLDQQSIVRLISVSAGSSSSTVLIGLYGVTWLPFAFPPPVFLHLLIIGSFVMMMIVHSVLLWQYKEQLTTVVTDLAQVNTDLEQRVHARTVELQVAKEAAERANQAKSVFVANVSHEWRTPLTALLSFTEFLRDREPLSERGQRWVARIATNGNHLLQLINDVLDLMRIESGYLEITRVPSDLMQVLHQVQDTADVLLTDKPVTFRLDLPDGLPPVLMDDTRIQQVLFNLVANAAKFTERGQIVITAVVHANVVAITVQDTGIGIAAVDQTRIFAPFQQVGRRTNQGTGLGLTICQQIIDRHDGTLTVASTPGVGSSFTFTLPCIGDEMVGCQADLVGVTAR